MSAMTIGGLDERVENYEGVYFLNENQPISLIKACEVSRSAKVIVLSVSRKGSLASKITMLCGAMPHVRVIVTLADSTEQDEEVARKGGAYYMIDETMPHYVQAAIEAAMA